MADRLFLGLPNHLFDFRHWWPSDFIGTGTLALSGLVGAFEISNMPCFSPSGAASL